MATNASETVAIERELVIAASPETVWEFLVDPEKASTWMGMQFWSEPRAGGLYRVAVIPGTAFGVTDGCYFRVAYGALQKDTVAEGIGRLVAGLRALVG